MSYNVTIIRTGDGKRRPILREEVAGVVESRRELRATDGDGGTLDVTIRSRGEDSPVLVWQDGEVWTRNPSVETLQLMIDLATQLDARVRGDELETYRTPAESYVHPDDAGLVRQVKAATKRSIVRHRLMGFLPVLLMVLVALLYSFCSGPSGR